MGSKSPDPNGDDSGSTTPRLSSSDLTTPSQSSRTDAPLQHKEDETNGPDQEKQMLGILEAQALTPSAERDLENGPPCEDSTACTAEPGTSHGEERDPNLVHWDGPDDPDNPMNWSKPLKWYITMMMSFLTFCITFSSSIFSQATLVTAEEFGVSQDVTTLATTLVLVVSPGHFSKSTPADLFG
jgi:hypothetical protein